MRWKYLILVVVFGVGPACSRLFPLRVESAYFCDLFENGRCRDRRDGPLEYRVKAPAYKLDSWYNLGFYMYFHSRQTPGLRVDFTRDLSTAELERFEKELECTYTLAHGAHRVRGELEGRRVDQAGFWCFDYLGTMLLRLQRERHVEKQRPDPAFFPVRLVLEYQLPGTEIAGALTGDVSMSWEVEK